MSERAPYSRVYWTVMDDAKFDGIRENPRHFGSWCLLLIVADMAHPAPAFPPSTVPRSSMKALTDAGLVDALSGGRFRIHGLEAERGRRSETGRNAAGARWQSERTPDAMRTHPERTARRAKQSKDETSKAEQDAPDPFDDPERDAVTWLARNGCALQPNSGYYRHLVTMVETYGVNAVVGMFDRLASSGTKHGDVKGYVFGAKDALDHRTRPSTADITKAERVGDIAEGFQRRLARTRALIEENSL